MSISEKKCPVHDTELLLMMGCGWDYDRLICPEIGCYYEIELETISYPEDDNEKEND